MDLSFADRSDRGKLRIAGPQDAWFLHQVLTQDFESMVPGEARDAAQITAHGRMVGYLECLRTDEGFFVHYEASLRAVYPEELARYVFATQVDIDDVSDGYGLVLVVGQGWERAATVAGPGPLHPTQALGIPAGYLWVPASQLERSLTALRSEAAEIDEAGLEEIRISHGVPRWGAEMASGSLPQESGADARAVHYDKGCYVGQEAMAKIHFRGKPNKRLARVEGPHLEVGDRVLVGGADVGRVTSVAGHTGLAIVKHSVAPDAELQVAPNAPDEMEGSA